MTISLQFLFRWISSSLKEDKKNKGKKETKREEKKSTFGNKLQMDVLGLVRIRVRRGINLAVRDTVSSDPYCVVTSATQVCRCFSVSRLNPDP